MEDAWREIRAFIQCFLLFWLIGKFIDEFNDYIDPNRKLSPAIAIGDIEAIRKHIESGGSLTQRCSNGDTLLILAIRGEQLGIVRMLLEAGDCAINATDEYSNSALSIAMMSSNIGIYGEGLIRLLLNFGAVPNIYKICQDIQFLMINGRNSYLMDIFVMLLRHSSLSRPFPPDLNSPAYDTRYRSRYNLARMGVTIMSAREIKRIRKHSLMGQLLPTELLRILLGTLIVCPGCENEICDRHKSGG